MKSIIKKAAAAALSLALLGSAMPFEAGMLRLPQFTLTADAATGRTAVLDETTGTLTLSGNVVMSDVMYFADNSRVTSVVAAPGTVLPSNCRGMFQFFKYAQSIDLHNADTSNVTDMSFMFGQCLVLTSLDLSSFDTSDVTSMRSMFASCESLTELDIRNFTTSNVTDMVYMFAECEALNSLDLSSFDTSKVTNMHFMFQHCIRLTSLDLSGFDTSNVTNMSEMFIQCYALKTIIASDWNTEKVSTSNSMFSYCSNLVGGKGTTYDNNHIDAEYARIDGGESNPGYFTNGNLPFDESTGTLTLTGKIKKISSTNTERTNPYFISLPTIRLFSPKTVPTFSYPSLRCRILTFRLSKPILSLI